ncbi:MAG TPA: hypothetical protein ACHBX0_01240 [Arsenophonus sp.]
MLLHLNINIVDSNVLNAIFRCTHYRVLDIPQGKDRLMKVFL